MNMGYPIFCCHGVATMLSGIPLLHLLEEVAHESLELHHIGRHVPIFIIADSDRSVGAVNFDSSTIRANGWILFLHYSAECCACAALHHADLQCEIIDLICYFQRDTEPIERGVYHVPDAATLGGNDVG